MISKLVQSVVESLCSEGCAAVSDFIVSLEDGDVLEQTKHLNSEDYALVLAELKSIMAVYDKRGA